MKRVGERPQETSAVDLTISVHDAGSDIAIASAEF